MHVFKTDLLIFKHTDQKIKEKIEKFKKIIEYINYRQDLAEIAYNRRDSNRFAGIYIAQKADPYIIALQTHFFNRGGVSEVYDELIKFFEKIIEENK